MLKPAEETCLLIADVSGYTGYLTSTELEHAQDVINSFLSTVVAALEPTFELVEAEGDAVFVAAPVAGLNGQLVLDVVDAAYFEFRRQSRDVVLATTCECNACRQIPSLDFKFVVHAGSVARSTVARRVNLTGPAVIVAHRLLKNSVAERLGGHAYLLVSQQALVDLGVDPLALAGIAVDESYADVGEIALHAVDMELRWRSAESAADLQVRPDVAALRHEARLPATPPVIWDWLLDPRKRLLWQPGISAIDEDTATGRREVGTAIHCAHGEGIFTERLLEWRPFERFTWEVDLPGYGTLRNTISLRREGEGTMLLDLSDGPRDDAQAQAWPMFRQLLRESAELGYAKLAQLLGQSSRTEV